MVDKCIDCMKKGNAVGIDGLTVEHLVYSHPALVVHLTVLFNIVLVLRAIDRSARSTDRAALSADCAAHSTDPPIEKH